MIKNILSLIILLNYGTIVLSQESFSIVDSLKIEKLTKGYERHYFKPNLYKVNLPIALKLIDNNFSLNKKSLYFQIKKVHIVDRISFYLVNERKYSEALDVLLKNINDKNKINETKTICHTYRLIGNNFLNQKYFVKAKEYYLLALKKAKEFNNNNEEVEILISHSILDFINKDYKKVRQKLELGLNLADSIGYLKGKNKIYSRYIKLYKKQKEYTKAMIFLKKSQSVHNQLFLKYKSRDSIGLSILYFDLGAIYRKTDKPKLAIKNYLKSIDYIKWNPKSRMIKWRYLGLSNAYVTINDYKNAYEYYLKYKDIDKEQDKLNKFKKTVALETKFKIKKEKAIDSLKFLQKIKFSEQVLKRKKNNQLWLLSILFLVITSVFIVLYYERKQRVIKTLLKNEKLESELKSQEKDLTEFAVNISHHKRWSDEIIKHIKDLRQNKGKLNENLLNEIEKDINEKLIYDDIANQFYNKINELGNSFYNNLKNKYPNLSKNEIHLCSLIKMKLSTLEISQLQNISVASVNTSRYRLRKKMKLDSNVNLDDFINKNL